MEQLCLAASSSILASTVLDINLFEMLLHTRICCMEGSWIHREGLRAPRPRWQHVWNKLDTHGIWLYGGSYICAVAQGSNKQVEMFSNNFTSKVWLACVHGTFGIFFNRIHYKLIVSVWAWAYENLLGHTEICLGPLGPIRKKHPNSSTHSECNLWVCPWTLEQKWISAPRTQSETQTHIGGGKLKKHSRTSPGHLSTFAKQCL